MEKPARSVHLWFPNIFEFKGGIQVYSAFLLQALQELYPQGRYQVFLKHDRGFGAIPPRPSPQTQFWFTGGWPGKLRTTAYATQIISQGVWQRPDLVIATHLNFTPAAYILKAMTGVPYWAIAHGVEAWDIQSPSLKTAIRGADRILAVSHYTRDRLLKDQGLPESQVGILPNTFDISRFHLAPKPTYLLQRYGLKPEQPIILTVARLDSSEQYKGYDQILRALPTIRQQVPGVHYLIVGKGNDRPRIEQLIQQLQLQDGVTLTGFIPDHELGPHYNLCDLFAMPSKGEGFGIVYLEALACGKPVLAGNRDGAVDALCRGELGVLVNPDAVEEIGQTISQILLGKHLHPLLYQPERLRDRVNAEFGLEQFKRYLSATLGQSPLSA